MKYLPLLLTLAPFLAFSKTRLNDYYVGFEIATVDHDTIDGELFDFSELQELLEESEETKQELDVKKEDLEDKDGI